mgnify:CR=1 FL=1
MISSRKVEHVGPLDAKIFILGEAPGADEDYFGQPFVGKSGEFLTHCLDLAGIDRSLCRIGNVCNYRPDHNDFKLLLSSRELAEGRQELDFYLASQRPRVIIALGNEALRYLRGHPGISDWRGSVLSYSDSSFVIPTYHPAAALRDGTFSPQIVHDLTKARRVLEQGYTAPVHDFIIDPGVEQLDSILEEVRAAPFIAADIETGIGGTYIKCFGFAVSRTRAFVFRNHFPEGCEPIFAHKISAVLSAAKSVVYHNGSYDTSQLRENHVDFAERLDYDTMLAQRVLQPELPIGLAFCASIYTDEPYYKNDGKETSRRVSWEQLARYNCTDCIVTFATREEQEKLFRDDPVLAKDREFIFSRIPLMQELQRNGMLVDEERRSLLRAATQQKLEKSVRIVELATGFSLNFRSHAQVKELLYSKLKLPYKTNRDGDVTSNEDAIVSLIQYVKGQIDEKKTDEGRAGWILKLHTLRAILDIRGYEKLISSYFEAPISPDGRVRSSYYPAGTDTGRWSCGTYVDGSGLNAQTLPRSEIEL